MVTKQTFAITQLIDSGEFWQTQGQLTACFVCTLGPKKECASSKYKLKKNSFWLLHYG